MKDKKVHMLHQGVFYDALVLDKITAVSANGGSVPVDHYLIKVLKCYTNEHHGLDAETAAMMEGQIFPILPSEICNEVKPEPLQFISSEFIRADASRTEVKKARNSWWWAFKKVK